MRSAVGIALALVVQLVGAGLAPGQQVLEENPYYLRADDRLQVTLNVQADQPTLSQIIATLRQATGLDIAVDGNLKDHAPDYGHIQPSQPGYHAWQIMEMVARKDLRQGYWEKTDEGYRLVGTSLLAVAPIGQTPAPAPAAQPPLWRQPAPWLVLASILLAASAGLCLFFWRRRATNPSKSPA